MASTYTNDLRIEEQTDGENASTWGQKLNAALEQTAGAFGYGTKALSADANQTFTMPDGTDDGTRSLYLKITSSGSLTATRTVTLGPNTISKVWIVENATTGSQSIAIKQGSGAEVTIANGSVRVLYTDGAGAGAAVVDALTDLIVSGTLGVGTTSPQGSIDLGNATGNRSIAWGGANGSAHYTTIWSEYGTASLILGAGLKPADGAAGFRSPYTGTYGYAGIELDSWSDDGIKFYAGADASRTKDAAITPAEVMRISTVGKVAIGDTDATHRMTVRHDGADATPLMVVNRNGADNNTTTIGFKNDDAGAGYYPVYIGTKATDASERQNNFFVAVSDTDNADLATDIRFTVDRSGNGTLTGNMTAEDALFKGDLTVGYSGSGGNAVIKGAITVGDAHVIGDDANDNLKIVSSAGEAMYLDSGTYIYLDHGTSSGHGVFLQTGGTTYGQIRDSSGSLFIECETDDASIVFRGIDDGTTISMLTLDASAGGDAKFSGTVTSESTTGDATFVAYRNQTSLVNEADGSNLIGAYLFKSSDTSGEEPHYAGIGGFSNKYGQMELQFFTSRDRWEADPRVPTLTLDKDKDATFAGSATFAGNVDAPNYSTNGYLALSTTSTGNNYALIDINDTTFDYQLRQYNGSAWVTSLSIDQVDQTAIFSSTVKAESFTVSTSSGKIAFANDAANYYIYQKNDVDGIFLNGYYGVSLGHRGTKKLSAWEDRVQIDTLITGGFGATTTSGTLDFDHLSNSRPGMGYTLLRGGNDNGPELGDAMASAGGGSYYYSMNFEYATKDGSGSLTQIAIPYHRGTSGSYNKSAISLRNRYSGTWGEWQRYLYLDVASRTANVDGALYVRDDTSGAYGRLEVGGEAGAYIDLSRPDSDDFDMRFETTGTENFIYGKGNYIRIQPTAGSGSGALELFGKLKYYTTDDQVQYWVAYTHTDDTFRFNQNNTGGDEFILYGNGNLTITGALSDSSDERLKENIQVIPDAVSKVQALRGVTYTRKDNGEKNTGLIAQDVAPVLPELVDDSGDFLALRYARTVGLLVEAIKEQQLQIDELKSEIQTLKA